MLNIETLKDKINEAVTTFLEPALREAYKTTLPVKSDEGTTMAETFAKTATELFAEPFADALAGAVDYYVRSISIQGTIITTGSPMTQTAVIASPQPATNGKIPNSLGIM